MAISHGFGFARSAESPPAAAVVSRSTCLRERGNTLYHEATAAAIPSVRASRLQDAIQLYCQALSLSQSDSERAMCCKNLGQAFWARAKITLGTKKSIDFWASAAWESLTMDLLSSAGYFLEALAFSRPASQRKEWVQGIHWTLVDLAWTVDDMRASSASSSSRKSKLLLDLCSVFRQKVPPSSSSDVKLQASAILHKACAQQGLEVAAAASSGNGNGSVQRQQLLRACLDHLKIAQAHTDAGAGVFLVELQTLRDSALKQLDHLCQSHYNKPLPEVKPEHVEQQSEVKSGMRSFQDRRGGSFRCPQSQGRKLLRSRSLRSPPPTFASDKSGESRELEAMFEELSPYEFLTALYERFPPPAGANKSAAAAAKATGGGELLRSAYKRAISHYHPDHHKAGQQQRLLCDEITKYLIITFNSLRKTEPTYTA